MSYRTLWRRFESIKRVSVLRLLAALLLLQGASAHLHSYIDHPESHGHTSAVALHLTSALQLPADADSESPALEVSLFGMLKNFSIALPIVIVTLVLLLLSVAIVRFRPRHGELFHPPGGTYVLTPPLRAPPR